MNERTIAIGDIHGCSTALAAILNLIDPQPDDTIVTLGDYVDRVLDSKGVFDQLIALSGRCHLVPITRILVPLTAEVLEFYNNLGKWFLHFSEPESLDKAILLRRPRSSTKVLGYRRLSRAGQIAKCATSKEICPGNVRRAAEDK